MEYKIVIIYKYFSNYFIFEFEKYEIFKNYLLLNYSKDSINNLYIYSKYFTINNNKSHCIYIEKIARRLNLDKVIWLKIFSIVNNINFFSMSYLERNFIILIILKYVKVKLCQKFMML